MINISNMDVYNFENAFRGLRNPMNSWDKSDSGYGCSKLCNDCNFWECRKRNKYYLIGTKDMELAQRMIKGGSSESKFLRQIFVSMDIDAPLYWWKEMDTYKVSTVANSCSTMHKISSTSITEDCFSIDADIKDLSLNNSEKQVTEYIEEIISFCELLRLKYLETKDKKYWRALIQILPESWNQKRTWTANYQVLRKIYQERLNHKLVEWHEFCKAIMQLPYAENLISI